MGKLRGLCLLITLLALSPAAFSQFSSNLQEVVEDPSESSVPGAVLKLRNVDIGVTAQATSSEAGYYRFTSLQPGNYQLSVEGNGFQPKKVNLILSTGTTTDANVTLALSSTTETIQVTEQAALLDTAETKIQVVLRSEALCDLPVAGRNFLSLVAVAPGITGTGVAGFGASGGSQSDNFTNEASPSVSAKWAQSDWQFVQCRWVGRGQQHHHGHLEPESESGHHRGDVGPVHQLQRRSGQP